MVLVAAMKNSKERPEKKIQNYSRYGNYSKKQYESEYGVKGRAGAQRASLTTKAHFKQLLELVPFTYYWPKNITRLIQQSKGGEAPYSPHQGKVTRPH